jgi:DNA-directed RNA polymerase specialized sigma24 family protein
VEELEVIIYGPKGVTLSTTPSSGGNNPGSALENSVIRLSTLRDQYKQKVETIAAELDEIEKAIAELQPRERQLIRLYYVEGLTWEQVAVVMGYSWRQVHRIHGDALRQLEKQEKEMLLNELKKELAAGAASI